MSFLVFSLTNANLLPESLNISEEIESADAMTNLPTIPRNVQMQAGSASANLGTGHLDSANRRLDFRRNQGHGDPAYWGASGLNGQTAAPYSWIGIGGNQDNGFVILDSGNYVGFGTALDSHSLNMLAVYVRFTLSNELVDLRRAGRLEVRFGFEYRTIRNGDWAAVMPGRAGLTMSQLTDNSGITINRPTTSSTLVDNTSHVSSWIRTDNVFGWNDTSTTGPWCTLGSVGNSTDADLFAVFTIHRTSGTMYWDGINFFIRHLDYALRVTDAGTHSITASKMHVGTLNTQEAGNFNNTTAQARAINTNGANPGQTNLTHLGSSALTVGSTSGWGYVELTASHHTGYVFVGWFRSNRLLVSTDVPYANFTDGSVENYRSWLTNRIGASNSAWLSVLNTGSATVARVGRFARTNYGSPNHNVNNTSVNGHYYTAVYLPVTYTVGFHRNAPSGVTVQTTHATTRFQRDTSANLPLYNPTTSPVRGFDGWATTSGGGVAYANAGLMLNGISGWPEDTSGSRATTFHASTTNVNSGDNLTVSLHLYAKWSAISGSTTGTILFYEQQSPIVYQGDGETYQTMRYTVRIANATGNGTNLLESDNGAVTGNIHNHVALRGLYARFLSGYQDGERIKMEYSGAGGIWEVPFASGAFIIEEDWEAAPVRIWFDLGTDSVNWVGYAHHGYGDTRWAYIDTFTGQTVSHTIFPIANAKNAHGTPTVFCFMGWWTAASGGTNITMTDITPATLVGTRADQGTTWGHSGGLRHLWYHGRWSAEGIAHDLASGSTQTIPLAYLITNNTTGWVHRGGNASMGYNTSHCGTNRLGLHRSDSRSSIFGSMSSWNNHYMTRDITITGNAAAHLAAGGTLDIRLSYSVVLHASRSGSVTANTRGGVMLEYGSTDWNETGDLNNSSNERIRHTTGWLAQVANSGATVGQRTDSGTLSVIARGTGRNIRITLFMGSRNDGVSNNGHHSIKFSALSMPYFSVGAATQTNWRNDGNSRGTQRTVNLYVSGSSTLLSSFIIPVSTAFTLPPPLVRSGFTGPTDTNMFMGWSTTQTGTTGLLRPNTTIAGGTGAVNYWAVFQTTRRYTVPSADIYRVQASASEGISAQEVIVWRPPQTKNHNTAYNLTGVSNITGFTATESTTVNGYTWQLQGNTTRTNGRIGARTGTVNQSTTTVATTTGNSHVANAIYLIRWFNPFHSQMVVNRTLSTEVDYGTAINLNTLITSRTHPASGSESEIVRWSRSTTSSTAINFEQAGYGGFGVLRNVNVSNYGSTGNPFVFQLEFKIERGGTTLTIRRTYTDLTVLAVIHPIKVNITHANSQNYTASPISVAGMATLTAVAGTAGATQLAMQTVLDSEFTADTSAFGTAGWGLNLSYGVFNFTPNVLGTGYTATSSVIQNAGTYVFSRVSLVNTLGTPSANANYEFNVTTSDNKQDLHGTQPGVTGMEITVGRADAYVLVHRFSMVYGTSLTEVNTAKLLNGNTETLGRWHLETYGFFDSDELAGQTQLLSAMAWETATPQCVLNFANAGTHNITYSISALRAQERNNYIIDAYFTDASGQGTTLLATNTNASMGTGGNTNGTPNSGTTSGGFTVTLRQITINWSGITSVQYNGAGQGRTGTITHTQSGSAIVAGGSIRVSGTILGTSVGAIDNPFNSTNLTSTTTTFNFHMINAGTYSLPANLTPSCTRAGCTLGTACANYQVTNATTQFEITPRELTVQWDGTNNTSFTYIYNGGIQGPTLTVGNIASADTLSFGATSNNGISIFRNQATQGISFTIDKTVAGTFVQSHFGARAVGAQYGVTVSSVITALGSSISANYVMPATGLTATWVINQREVVLSWNLLDNLSYVYNAQNRQISLTVSGVQTGDTVVLANTGTTAGWAVYPTNFSITSTGQVFDFSAINAGTYTITIGFAVGGNPDDNYALSGATQRTITITKKPITVTWETVALGGAPPWDGFSTMYSNQQRAVIATVLDGAVSDTCGRVYTADASGMGGVQNMLTYTNRTGTTVAQYNATVAFLTSGTANNYQFSDNTTSLSGSGTRAQTWHITQRIVEFNWFGVGGGWAELSTVYDGTQKEVDTLISNLATGDSGVTLIRGGTFTATNAGEYTATITGVSNSNYRLPVFGEAGYDKLIQIWDISKRTVSAVWSPAPVSGKWLDFYTGAHIYKTLTLSNISTRAQLGVTFALASNPAGLELFSVSGGSLNNSNALNPVASSTAVGSGTAESMSMSAVFRATLKGEYSIALFGFDNDNYILEIASVEWNIDEREVVISFSAETLSFVYNAQNQGALMGVLGVVSGDYINLNFTITRNSLAHASSTIYNLENKTLGLGYNEFAQRNVGLYTVTITGISGADSDNYKLSGTLSKDFSITPKPIEIHWEWDDNGTVKPFTDGLFTYNGLLRTITPNFTTGAVGATHNLVYIGDSITLSATGNSQTNVGNSLSTAYQAVASISGGADIGNYSISISTKAWWINQAKVSVDFGATPPAFTYNGSWQGITAEVSGVFAGDRISLDFNGEGITATSVITANTVTAINFYAVNAKATAYQITLNGISDSNSANNNYVLCNESETEATYVINPQPISITSWGTTSFVFNGSERTLNTTLSPIHLNVLTGQDAVSINWNINLTSDPQITNKATNAGNYMAIALSVDNTNYTLTGTTVASWEITPALVTISWTHESPYTYDRTEKGVTANIVSASGATTDGLSISYEIGGETGGRTWAGVATNAGLYVARAVLLGGNGNYELYGGNLALNWEINPAPVTVVWNILDSEPATLYQTAFTYNGGAQGVYPQFIGLIGEDTTGTVNYSFASILSATNAGEYTSTILSLANTNYTLTGGLSLDWEINPAELTASWHMFNTLNIPYTVPYTFNNSAQGLTLSLTGFVGSDTAVAFVINATDTFVSGTNVTAVNQGTYEVFVSLGLGVTNYILTGATETEFVINPYQITLEWIVSGTANLYNSEQGITYNGLPQGVTARVALTSFGLSPALTFTYETIGSNICNEAILKGTYTARVTAIEPEDDNYILGTELELIWKIVERVIEISFDPATITHTYNTLEQGVLMGVSGVMGSDRINLHYEITRNSLAPASGAINNLENRILSLGYNVFGQISVGEYVVTIISISGADSENYTFAGTLSKAFTISPKVIDIDWIQSDNGNEYSEPFVYNGTPQGITAVYSSGASTANDGLVYDSDSVSFDYLNNLFTNSGNYQAQASSQNENYIIRTGGNTKAWAITPATLTASWHIFGTVNDTYAEPFTFNNSAQGLTLTLTGFVNGETSVAYVLTLDGATVIGLDATAVNAGTYEAIVSLHSSVVNYILTGVTETEFEITPYEISLEWYTTNTDTIYSLPFSYTSLPQGITARVAPIN
ncbi:MAG: hypothetical protein FWD49_04850, partial [Firmicutes bacterium]|nr:hypothetical protein [Bacillota bacterium]